MSQWGSIATVLRHYDVIAPRIDDIIAKRAVDPSWDPARTPLVPSLPAGQLAALAGIYDVPASMPNGVTFNVGRWPGSEAQWAASSEYAPRLSPDGRWIAYASTESGRAEVYVRPFPNVDQGRWQVSIDGGTDPRWAKNGRELVFSLGGNPNRTFWSSVLQPGTSFVAGKPAQIPTSARARANASAAYDVSPDGRLLVSMPLNTGIVANASQQVVVVQNWFDELKARVPAARRD